MSLGTNSRDHGLQTVCIFCTLLLTGAMLPFRAAQADIIWDDYYSDEDAVVNGSVLAASGGVNVTIGTTVFSDNDGGTFDLDPYINSDYITFERQRLGNVRRHIQFSMDNQNDDPADFVELTLTFDQAVTNLQFTMLDIDSGSWDDAIEVFYNGTNNARDNTGITVVDGAFNGIDNETYMNGWEGYGSNAFSNETFGNIDFDFGTIELTSLTFRYFSTDDASSNPGGQISGLSDVTFIKAIPEARTVGCCMLFAAFFGLSLWRQSRNRGRCRRQRNERPTPLQVTSQVRVRPQSADRQRTTGDFRASVVFDDRRQSC